MKRMISLLMAALMLAGLLTACGPSQSTEASSGKKLNIVTTIFPQYDFARQIAGDHAEVTMLLKPGAESHSFEPTPQDIKKIQSADLFIYTGGENDVLLSLFKQMVFTQTRSWTILQMLTLPLFVRA